MTTSIAGCNRSVGWIDLGGMGRGNPNPGKEENSNQTNKRVLSSKQMLKSGGIALIVYDSHIALSPNIGCKVHTIKSSLPSLLLASFKKIWNLSNACSCCRVSFVHTESSASRSKGLSRKDSQSSSEDAHTDLHKKNFSLSDHFKTFVCHGLIVRWGWSKSDKLYTCV